MRQPARVTVSMQELDRLKCIEAVVEGTKDLRVVQLVQAKRDSRSVHRPSTAHRANGTRIPRTRVVDSKPQRELGPEDLQKALDAVCGAVAVTFDPGASAALRASDSATVGRRAKAKIRERMVAQADTST